MKRVLLISMLFLIFIGCKNPFAPDIVFDQSKNGALISDLSTPDGAFKNLSYAYSFKDTLIYGGLLEQSFLFTYRDYDLGYDVTWGRPEEMRITNGLFQNAERLDLVWNNTLATSFPDSTHANIVRGFNLLITFNPSDVVRVDGRVNLQLEKSREDGKWRIIRWLDESNF